MENSRKKEGWNAQLNVFVSELSGGYIMLSLPTTIIIQEFLFLHFRTFENTRLVFSTFPLYSQMPVVFYHSVIHGLGFFIC